MKYLSILAGATASVFLLAGQTVTLAQQQTPEQNNPAVTPEQSTSIEVNDEEIQSFASAFEVVQTIQDESRQKMVEAIEEQGLTIKEYNELLRQQQQPEGTDSEASNVSEEKQEQFQQADAQIEQIEQEAQADIEAAITDEGLQIERFQEIWIAVRQDPELQQQVKNYLEN
jgi:DNA-binding transcriptional MerR regulator